MSKRKLLTAEQNELVVEFVEAYGIAPEDVMFFNDKPDPTFSYEATCLILNHLCPDIRGVIVEPAEPFTPESIPMRCILTFADGRTRSAVGVINRNEKDADGEALSDQQLYSGASGRAIRQTLRTAGLDLVTIHRKGTMIPEPGAKSNSAALIARAHALGQELGLINEDGKELWHRMLENRYGVHHSNQLGDELLADFVAFLGSLRGPASAKAAA